MKIIALIFLFFFIGLISTAQTKVAVYACGKSGSSQYESFSFWVKDGKRTKMYYAYGKENKEIKLRYLGKSKMQGKSCFKVQFPNKYFLYVITTGLQLKVTDATGKYNKTFAWEYEGPVNGIGTYCDVCAGDEEEAMQLIQSFYIK